MEDIIRLTSPVIISLVATIILSVKLTKHNIIMALLIMTIINLALLSWGTLWFWSVVTDGLAQIIQAIIYAICFVLIFVINIIVILVRGRKKKVQ